MFQIISKSWCFFREMERLEQEAKMKELEELRRKVEYITLYTFLIFYVIYVTAHAIRSGDCEIQLS